MVNSCLIITFARSSHLEELITSAKLFCKKIYIYQNQSYPAFDVDCKKVTKTIQKNIDKNVIFFRPPKYLLSEQSIVYAITKFFEFEKYGTIFEDDCLPSKSFWDAIRFLKQEQIGYEKFVLNGFTPVPQNRSMCTISKKKYLHVWGWTTNASTWQQFLNNYEIKNLTLKTFLNLGFPLKSSFYWLSIFRLVSIGIIKTWDYKFLYYLWTHKIKIYGPSENLIQNMGSDKFSQFLKEDFAGIKDIAATNEISEFQSKLNEFDKSETSTNVQHYKITWGRIIRLLLINLKAMVNSR